MPDQAPSALQSPRRRAGDVFRKLRVAIWEEDFSAVVDMLDGLRRSGVTDLRSWLDADPDRIDEAIRQVRVTDVNDRAVELFEAADKQELLAGRDGIVLPETADAFVDVLMALWEGRGFVESEAVLRTLKGRRLDVMYTIAFLGDRCESSLVTVQATAQRVVEARREAERAAQHLAAIVESSHDAIVSKDLQGTILSWNAGAERLFGYPAEQVIGKPITMLIPEDRLDEETMILGRIGRGERVEDFETVRQHKDGRLIDISLTVSPVKDSDGNIVGASKIARNISDRKQAREQQALLLREMSHRVKNLVAVASGLMAMSARHAKTPEALSSAVRDRLSALAKAHDLARPVSTESGMPGAATTTLHGLIRSILAPYANEPPAGGDRLVLKGRDFAIGGSAVADMALVLHELATNAAKYGAFAVPAGCVLIDTSVEGNELMLEWTESGGAPIAAAPDSEGFGNMLMNRVAVGRFGGQVARDWRPEGLSVRLSLPLARLAE
jgi:PAS domain S-box-containing protein